MKRAQLKPALLALAAAFALAAAPADAAPRKRVASTASPAKSTQAAKGAKGNAARAGNASRGGNAARGGNVSRGGNAARGTKGRKVARAPAHAPPIPVKPVVESPVADLPFPRFDQGAQVASACTAGMEGAMLRLKELERRQPGADWLKGWEALYDWQEDQSGALIFLQNVHPSAEVRAEAEKCDQRWADFQSGLALDDKVYAGARDSVALLRDPIDRRAAQLAVDAFEDSGVTLSRDKQARAKAIAARLLALSQQFNRNILDGHTRVAFSDAELRGVPDAAWKDQPRDADGKVTLAIDGPAYAAVMQRAEDAGARERLWRAKTNQGGADNLKVLAQIEQLRLEQARLFGFASYDEFVLRRRMVESPARAARFLDEVRAAVVEGDRRDVAELRDAKARHLGQAAEATRVQRWDTMFYSERLQRERGAVDDDAFRPYFPPQESLRFVMRVAEKLFGIRYDRIDVAAWAPEVQVWAVTDAASNRRLATLYVDPYPREGKYNRAAVWNLRNAATDVPRQAQSALVVNFDRRGLSLRELETLMHEFAHTLRNNLSATRYASNAGENVAQDFVEAPSQMLEDWVYDKQVLKVFQEVCPACRPVPDDLVDKARAARDFAKASGVARQDLYAAYDLALHGPGAPDPLDTWQRMEGATTLGYVPGTLFPAGFAHIAGAYGAGYYGYLWSQSVATDMRSAFGTDKLDARVGARYRGSVLSEGGQKPPQQVVKEFLGRDLSAQAFFDDLRK